MKQLTILFLSVTALLASCIQNDIPYPQVVFSIQSMEGNGFSVSKIDLSTRTVTLTLDEATDIQNVNITGVAFDAELHSTNVDKQTFLNQLRLSQPLTGTFDLRTPIYVTLSLYQDYDWTITAEQTIERNFSVAGQVGRTAFDLDNRTATAYVAKDTDRSKITITQLKLGPAQATYNPSMEQLSTMDFSDEASPSHFVDVSCYGRTERWLLYVQPTDKSVALTAADAWSRVIWLYGSGIEGVDMGFRYRIGSGEWADVPDVITEGGSIRAHIDAEPETTYEVVAWCGDDQTDPTTVTTDGVRALPNGSFEEWSESSGIIYPYLAGAEAYWDTGNKGAKLASETLTQSCDPRPGATGYGANLRSKFANIAGAGKLAAGNIFLGKYVTNDGTNGLLTFGRPFTLRPTALRIWVKYNRGVIDYTWPKNSEVNVGNGVILKMGDPDNGSVYIALGTWTKEKYGVVPANFGNSTYAGKMIGTDDSPYLIATRDATALFKSDGEDVVGYGEYIMTESVGEWTQVTIPIRYTATDIQPTHLMVVCSASRWGDYFTGSSKSEMWIDDFELVYDYVEEVIK